MTATPTTTFDIETLRRATQERDSESLLALFADDAEVTCIDKENQPSAPRILRGKDEIAEMLRDIYGRDMTHQVADVVQQGDRVAYTVNCRYPDGSRVLCMATLELRDGKIARQNGVQAWDD